MTSCGFGARSLVGSAADPPQGSMSSTEPCPPPANVCERHRFETTLLPKAIRLGWPRTIDFDALPGRIDAQTPALDAILARLRTSSFILEAARDANRLGPRRAESAMGQYATFERIQPGYYGERGAMVLFQALLYLYPPRALQQAQTRFAPVRVLTFVQSVLVTEAAVALIMEDLNANRETAIQTMRASARYGSSMFADDDSVDGEESLGDLLIRECARLRRNELDREEAEERERDPNE